MAGDRKQTVKNIGVVDRAKEYYLKKGEYVIPARVAKKIRRVARKTRRGGGRNA